MSLFTDYRESAPISALDRVRLERIEAQLTRMMTVLEFNAPARYARPPAARAAAPGLSR